MRFPRGVTGFAPAMETFTDARQFRADCFDVARNLNAKVRNREIDFWKSYVAQDLVWPDLALVVLLNKAVPIIGFCQVFEPGTLDFEFLDHERVAAQFLEQKRYELWNKAQLDSFVTDEMFEDLIEPEQRHAKYWRKYHRPMRVGDVVFNYWDKRSPPPVYPRPPPPPEFDRAALSPAPDAPVGSAAPCGRLLRR
jgi:hypothetical protein